MKKNIVLIRRIFIFFGVIILGLSSAGCITKQQEDSTLDNKYLTGPITNYVLTFDTFKEFSNFITDFNTTNNVFVSFDFDNLHNICEKKYIFSTVLDNG